MSIVSTFPVNCCRFFVALCGVLALTLASPFTGIAHATTVRYTTDAQLVALSERVLHGRVLDVRTEKDPDGNRIYTIARIAVLEDFTGFTDGVIEVRELGGTVGTTRLWIPGAAQYTPGEEVLVCLKQKAGIWHSVAKSYSAFHIDANAPGNGLVRRDVTGVTVIGAPTQSAASVDVRTIDDFRRTVISVKGAHSVTPPEGAAAAAAAGDSSTPVSEGFTLLGPLRWAKADTNAAVVWYRNPAYPAPPSISNVDALIAIAMQAWTNPTDASIILNFSGTRAIGADTPYCAPSVAGAGLITFEDPTDEIDAPVIAMGGGCSDGTTTTVNGTTFQGFSRAFAVFNNASEIDSSVLTTTNFLRVITHEVGHGIGLGHTQPSTPNATSNLMYASCCYSVMPVPPAIGPDDHDGLVFIYPVTSTPPGGGGPTSPGDADGDGLPDAWEVQYGLNPNDATGDNGAGGNPDHDDFNNLQEYQNNTHPRGFVKRYLAEGVVNQFFDTQLALLNPGDTTAKVLVRLQTDGGTEKPYFFEIGPHTRTTVTSATIKSLLTGGSFATLVESDQLVVVDRTVTWGGGYGSSAETAVESPSSTWYLAEGATGGPFDLFYLLQNPNAKPVIAQVTYLRPGGATPLVKSYTVPAKGRYTIWVDAEKFPDDNGTTQLASADVSGVISVTNGDGVACPADSTEPRCQIIVERSMYLSRPEQSFAAGHDAAGVTAPNQHWFLAEGATSNFFDMYVLIENPKTATAHVTVNYLLTSGAPFTKNYDIPGNSRFTILVNDEEIPAGSGQKPLAGAEISTVVNSDVPIVVERAMWWPRGNWYEAHDVAGSTESGTKWAVAEGEQGGPFNTHTYVLIANVGSMDANISVKVMLENGTVVTSPATLTVPASSRKTVEIADSPLFSGVNGKRFGVVVESVNGQPIVIERSMYSDYAGQFWAAGTAALGACLQCGATTPVTSSTTTSH